MKINIINKPDDNRLQLGDIMTNEQKIERLILIKERHEILKKKLDKQK